MSTRNCPSCGAPLGLDATECRYCGENIAVAQPQYQAPQPPPQYAQPQAPQYGQPQYTQVPQYGQPQAPQYTQPQYAQPQAPQYMQQQTPPAYTQNAYTSTKSKVVAGLLGIFLGGLGIHKFYLGKTGQGILYLLFCWTGIPGIIGFIEGIIYLVSSDEKFYTKYVRK